jgi:predicted DNA-binding transcriptional regulator AlpA
MEIRDIKLIRINQIIGTNGLIPISKTSWYAGIKTGIFPKPIKIGRTSLWEANEVHSAIERLKEYGTFVPLNEPEMIMRDIKMTHKKK